MSIPFPRVRVERNYEFIASHKLVNAKNPDAKVFHEHMYNMVVVLYSEVNPNVGGWAFDFDEIDFRVKPLLDMLWESNLNELLPFEPTSEMLACWCLAQLPPYIDGIRISESENSSAEIMKKDIKQEWLDKFRSLPKMDKDQ